MYAISLYQAKNSFIHKLDPISKLLYVSMMITFLLSFATPVAFLLCLLINGSILAIGRVFRKIFPLIGFSMVILLSVIIIQGILMAGNKTPLFQFGAVTFYLEGLTYAVILCLRVINMLCAFAILVLTTKPSDLIESLIGKGLPPKIGYVLSSVLQIIPQMADTTETILDAQRSRGLEIEGSLLRRIKAFFPLIGPTIITSLIITKERALALEVRGFNSPNPKTFIHRTQPKFYESIIQWILVSTIVVMVVWRLNGWLR